MKKIKSILLRVNFFFQSIFSKEYEVLKKHSYVAVKVTAVLKDIVENPLTGIVTELTPTGIDDAVLTRLRSIVPKVAGEMAIAHGIIQQSTSNADMFSAIINHLQSVHNPEGRVGFWMEFSARLNVALSDQKLTLSEAAALAQMVYAEYKTNSYS